MPLNNSPVIDGESKLSDLHAIFGLKKLYFVPLFKSNSTNHTEVCSSTLPQCTTYVALTRHSPPCDHLHRCQLSSRRNVVTMASSGWTQEDKRRMLHAVYRVGNMDNYIKYMKDCFGMQLLRYRDVPEVRKKKGEPPLSTPKFPPLPLSFLSPSLIQPTITIIMQGKYSNAFLGFGPEEKNFAIELTYNYGVESYDLGTGFGHFGLAVPDVYATSDVIKAANGKITREPGPVKGGQSVIAFAEDPSGYKWELIQRKDKSIPEPICQVMLRVSDLDRSVAFYRDVLGMRLLRTRDNPEYKYTLAFMGYGDEDSTTVFELTYNYGSTEYTKGEGYAQVAISTEDVYKTAEAIKAGGGNVSREPGPVPGIGTKIVACTDPDGWKIVFVDNEDFLKELK